jgi:hypothetical protein
MAIALTKIVDGEPAMNNGFKPRNRKCSECARAYRIGSSDEDWHKRQDWMKLSEAAARASHPEHGADSLTVVWKTGRRK